MIARDCRRLALLGLPVLILIYTAARFYRDTLVLEGQAGPSWILGGVDHDEPPRLEPLEPPSDALAESNVKPIGPPAHDEPKSAAPWEKSNHMEIFSASTPDRKFFMIDFGETTRGMNPNILPHPHLDRTWIVVAQEARGPDVQDPVFAEISCNAAFANDGALRCISPPARLPIAPTAGDKCTGDLAFFGLNAGPHDARVLYGPEEPYVLYGSNSALTCFGQWIHDFRELVGDWGASAAAAGHDDDEEKPGTPRTPDFRAATELQRPADSPYGAVEKNWFPFWDAAGRMYVHYDISPRRVLARIRPDGSAGKDLAPRTAAADSRCLARHMPALPPALESVHQATNSLSVTLCRRADPACVPGARNTFVLAVWQHKTFYRFHGVYEPYVMLFQRDAPFALHAVSRQPLWIHGREERPDRQTSDMMYVTSINWKEKGLNYHGFLDDELVLGFGIEDADSGGIDLRAGDLLANLGLCEEGQQAKEESNDLE